MKRGDTGIEDREINDNGVSIFPQKLELTMPTGGDR
jgi:hypothetical protein